MTHVNVDETIFLKCEIVAVFQDEEIHERTRGEDLIKYKCDECRDNAPEMT